MLYNSIFKNKSLKKRILDLETRLSQLESAQQLSLIESYCDTPDNAEIQPCDYKLLHTHNQTSEMSVLRVSWPSSCGLNPPVDSLDRKGSQSTSPSESSLPRRWNPRWKVANPSLSESELEQIVLRTQSQSPSRSLSKRLSGLLRNPLLRQSSSSSDLQSSSDLPAPKQQKLKSCLKKRAGQLKPEAPERMDSLSPLSQAVAGYRSLYTARPQDLKEYK